MSTKRLLSSHPDDAAPAGWVDGDARAAGGGRKKKTSPAEVAARRRQVADLWLRGVAPLPIAGVLMVSIGTIRRDLEAIREELAAANRASIAQSRDRSIAALRLVQEAAWNLFHTIQTPTATNKVGALNTIVAAEERIARLSGTLEPDVTSQTTINVLALPEWAQVRSALLAALATHPEARLDVAHALAHLEAAPPRVVVEGDGDGDGDGEGDGDDQPPGE